MDRMRLALKLEFNSARIFVDRLLWQKVDGPGMLRYSGRSVCLPDPLPSVPSASDDRLDRSSRRIKVP